MSNEFLLQSLFAAAMLTLCVGPLSAVEPALDVAVKPRDDSISSEGGLQEASDVELEQFCVAEACRKNVFIRLQRKDGTWYEQRRELMPPVAQSGFVTVLPGETVRLVPTFDGKKFEGWRLALEKDMDQAQVVTVHLQQDPDGSHMMATISNSRSPMLKLDLGMMVLEGPERPLKTSSCPIAGNGRSYEHWPHAIYSLLVGQATQLADDAEAICE